MATKKAKPDGQYYLKCDDVEAYMSEIPIQDLPGVGSSTAYTLREANLITCGDLQNVSLPKLQVLVGKKFGETLYQFCRGIDQKGLTYAQIRKSVSAEVNYGIRFKTSEELETFLKQLCAEVHNRLNDIKRKTKNVTLKLMVRAKEAPVETSKFMGHGVCDHITKSVSLSQYTNDLETITRCILTTMKAVNIPPHELRGIGIQLSKLDDPTEQPEKPKENIIKNMFSKVIEKQKEAKEEENKNCGRKLSMEVENSKDKYENNANADKKKSPDAKKSITTKRGRPKAAGISRDLKSKPNIMGMLKDAAAKTSKPKLNAYELQIPDDIDQEVFNALPPDIKEEILRDRAKSSNQNCKANVNKEKLTTSKSTSQSLLNASDFLPSTSKAAELKQAKKMKKNIHKPAIASDSGQRMEVDPDFLAALPAELRLEIEQQLNEQTNKQKENSHSSIIHQTNPAALDIPRISSDNIFTQSNCIELLLAWLQSCNVPENYDVDLMCSNARELVRAKELDKLYDSLLYLGRLIIQKKYTENDCPWHLAFKMIAEAVQLEMLQVYDGRKLFLPIKINCAQCTN